LDKNCFESGRTTTVGKWSDFLHKNCFESGLIVLNQEEPQLLVSGVTFCTKIAQLAA
jgi:hypothetical protein